MGSGSYIVQITYMERAVRQRLPDGRYPMNSKGETYGTNIVTVHIVNWDQNDIGLCFQPLHIGHCVAGVVDLAGIARKAPVPAHDI